MPGKNREIDLTLVHTNLRLVSENEELIEFVRRFSGIPVSQSCEEAPDICVNVRIDEQFVPNDRYVKISRSIWIAPNSVHIASIEKLPGLSMTLKVESNRLYVDAYMVERTRSRVATILSYLSMDERHNTFRHVALTYFLVYVPYFYFIERFRSLFLLHAGAISYEKECVILAGLGGIGKSTLSLAWTCIGECKLMSDNLVFHSPDQVYSFPEPVALDERSLHLLGSSREILVDTNLASSHGRSFYAIRSENRSFEARAKSLVWLQQGNENSLLRLEQKEKLARQLLNINLLANEMREYYVIAAAADLATQRALSNETHHNSLSSLLSNVDCYVLQFTPEADIKTLYDTTLAEIVT